MTDKEKLVKVRAEIERQIAELTPTKEKIGIVGGVAVKRHLDSLLSFIDSLQEEPVSEDLEEAAEMFIDSLIPTEVNTVTPFAVEYVIELLNKAIKFGANWQKEQMIIQLENIAYRRYSLDDSSEQRNKDLIKLIQSWKCLNGV